MDNAFGKAHAINEFKDIHNLTKQKEILITAGHELDDQFWKSNVGTAHLCTTHL